MRFDVIAEFGRGDGWRAHFDQYIIESKEGAQDQSTQWLWAYDNDRPNMGIGCITPAKKLFPKGARRDKMAA